MKKPRNAGLFVICQISLSARCRAGCWAAAALPALLVTPVSAVPPVALPVVVPVVEDPVVVLLVAAPPVAELPPAAPPLDCASAQVPVKTSAVANPNVASFMIAPSLGLRNGNKVRQSCVPTCRSQFVAVPSMVSTATNGEVGS
jgi:hypothetical protein